jgi:hypothetical protein
MTGIYRKWGSVVRYENGTIVHVHEAGEAREEGGVFTARPLTSGPPEPGMSMPHPFEASTLSGFGRSVDVFVAQTLLSVQPLAVERLIISAGMARHEANGVIWTEESQRVHLSLVNAPLRVLIDLASFDISLIESIASALRRAGDERQAPARIRLAPNVSAALLPALAGEIAMEQAGGGFDGKGQPIETRAVTADPPPNWYRPGYAVRPVRAWLNIRALPFGGIDRSTPIAVALLGPVDGTTLRVLCVDGAEVFPAVVRAAHLSAVSREEPAWYPYAGGSFGVEMML